MNIDIGFWDILLVVAVSIQATVIAYLYHPKWKAFMLNLPIPFTIAALAVGCPIDATNVLGLILLLFFTHGVRLLYQKFHFQIVLAIMLSALGYCIVGWTIASILPVSEAIFWISSIAIMVIAIILLKVFPHREEEGHRSPLPVWIKLPIVVAIILFLVLIKKGLQGFMTVFPMVGVIAAYEARKSLWTISRQIPVLMLTITPMMIVCRLVQNSIGLGFALLVGWIVFLIVLAPVTYFTY